MLLSAILRSRALLRAFHTARVLKWPQLTNILAGEIPPPVQVKSITNAGVLLRDGRLLPSACIFLEGEVLLWDVPPTLWKGWDERKFDVFDVVVPKPGASPPPVHRAQRGLIPFLFARNIAYWYGEICQPPASYLTTTLEQAWDSGRCHGLGERPLYFLTFSTTLK